MKTKSDKRKNYFKKFSSIFMCVKVNFTEQKITLQPCDHPLVLNPPSFMDL